MRLLKSIYVNGETYTMKGFDDDGLGSSTIGITIEIPCTICGITISTDKALEYFFKEGRITEW